MIGRIRIHNRNAFRKFLVGIDTGDVFYGATANGAQTQAAADASNARNVMIIITVVAAFTNGSGAQPTFSFGQTGSASAFGATSVLTNALVGQQFVLTGQLPATDALLVTAVAATGTGTGAIEVRAALFPVNGTQLP